MPLVRDESSLGVDVVGELDPPLVDPLVGPDDEGDDVPVTEVTVDLTVETAFSTLGSFGVVVVVVGSGLLVVTVGVEPLVGDVSGSGALGSEVLGRGVVEVDRVGSEVLGREVDGSDSAPVAEEPPSSSPAPRPATNTAIHLLRP